MKKLSTSKQFKKDLKKYLNDEKTEEVLRNITKILRDGEKLPKKYKDHKLQGDYSNCRDCHIKPDLILIYEATKAEITLIRIGTHSELF